MGLFLEADSFSEELIFGSNTVSWSGRYISDKKLLIVNWLKFQETLTVMICVNTKKQCVPNNNQLFDP